MTRRVIALSIGFLLSMAAVASGQEVELGRVLDRLASSWARGDANTLAALSARSGISLDIDGDPIGPLTHRQAAAVLRSLFMGRTTHSLSPGLARIVGGQPLRAFGELSWTVRTQGTTIPERTTIFLALVWEGDAWRITQIRLLR
jgi:hypothetical protein